MQSDSTSMVSVIVPICNVEKYLAQALESIQGQTHANLEIICINDGSTDSSLEVVQRFAANDDRFVVVDKQNEGYGATCNLGIDMARGEWISIIEPDDWIDEHMYADMIEFASRFEVSPDIVKTPWFNLFKWDDPKTLKIEKSELSARVPTSKKPFSLEEHPILIEVHPSIWSALYRREFLDEKNIRFIPYPGAGWADNPFLIETMCQADAIAYLDKPFYYYRADLPGATKNHGSDEAIARPFDRWMDMVDALERLGVEDRGILNAHYLRGFNYISGAIYDDGWDNPVVQQKTRAAFSRMDKDVVLGNPKLRNSVKRFYLKEMGYDDKVKLSAARMKNVMGESIALFKRNGVKDIAKRIKRRFEVRPKE